jgi:hypothetical protein
MAATDARMGEAEDAKVVHLGIFDFTGAFREKRLDSAVYPILDA